MARPHSPKINIIPEVSGILEKIQSRGKSEQRHSDRSKLILIIGQGGSNQRISKEYGKNYKTVKKWRLRYLSYQERFDKILLQLDKPLKKRNKDLLDCVYEMLSDAPRSGTPMKFTSLQYCQLLHLATQSPHDYNREINDWTARELKEEAEKQGIFESISETQVRDFLKRSRSETSSNSLLAQSQCGKC